MAYVCVWGYGGHRGVDGGTHGECPTALERCQEGLQLQLGSQKWTKGRRAVRGAGVGGRRTTISSTATCATASTRPWFHFLRFQLATVNHNPRVLQENSRNRQLTSFQLHTKQRAGILQCCSDLPRKWLISCPEYLLSVCYPPGYSFTALYVLHSLCSCKSSQ